MLAGEITSNAKLDFTEHVRDAVREIGYVNGDDVFHADTCRVICVDDRAIARYQAGRR